MQDTYPMPYRVRNSTCPPIVLGTSRSICTSYVDGSSKAFRYASESLWSSCLPVFVYRFINTSHAALRQQSGIPLNVRSRTLRSLDDLMSHISTFPPASRDRATSMRPHFAIREPSLAGVGLAGWRGSSGGLAGPLGTAVDICASGREKGAEGMAMRRSWEGVVKKPYLQGWQTDRHVVGAVSAT